MRISLVSLLAVVAFVAGCGRSTKDGAVGSDSRISRKTFGTGPGGETVFLFALENDSGMRATITNYGGIVVSLEVPDRDGNSADVVLGYDRLNDYIKDSPYFGCIVGRYGNRIGNAKFSLDGTTYELARNDDANSLHGGNRGFDKVVWTPAPRQTPDGPALVLHYVSADGEEGFPGRLDCTVTYTLTRGNELAIDYAATTDRPTHVNLTHHGYFNLSGADTIMDHVVTIRAAKFTPVDAGLIPTGELRPVKGTPFDFTSPERIGSRIDQPDEQIAFGKGYDHNWVLDSRDGSLASAATVEDAVSGRVMEVLTTEPGIQFYSGNFLDGTLKGKGGKVYGHRAGFCLETQHYPDSPNKSSFPSTVLKPGEKYESRTVYRFSVK